MENSSQYLMQCPTYYALLHLNRELRYLWIDSICINQAGRDEKATQIPLMSQIYPGATRNIAYLGDAEDARLVPDFVGRLNVAILQRFPEDGSPRSVSVPRRSSQMVSIPITASAPILVTNLYYPRDYSIQIYLFIAVAILTGICLQEWHCLSPS
jgi:hypothetical protein